MNKNNKELNIIYSYHSPYEERKQIYKDLKNKSGIYLWTNTISDKKYIGSSINLGCRFRCYFSKKRLESEVQFNNSLIYKAILKHGYSNFRLDIIEFCDKNLILTREQYYLDNLELKYNTLKVARSLLGFKHSELTKERMRKANIGRIVSIETKEKLYSNSQAFPVKIINLKTNEITYLPSIRRAALFITIHHTYLTKSLHKKKVYIGKGFNVTKVT